MPHQLTGSYVCLEGLIGVGKTTLHDRLSAYLREENFPFVSACPTKQQNPANLLERGFALRFPLRRWEIYRRLVYASRSRDVARITDWSAPFILGDRSVVTSYAEWAVWLRRLPWWLAIAAVDRFESTIPGPTDIVYLDAPVELSLDRLGKRPPCAGGREETRDRLFRTRDAYRRLRDGRSARRLRNTQWHVVDARPDAKRVFEETRGIVQRIYEARNCNACSLTTR